MSNNRPNSIKRQPSFGRLPHKLLGLMASQALGDTFLLCVSGFAGQVAAQAFENLFIHGRENDGGMDLTAPELAELLHGPLSRGVGGSRNGEGDECLIGM